MEKNDDTKRARDSLTSVDPSQPGEVEITVPTNTDPHGPRRWHSNMVQLSGHNRALNEFSVERIGEKVENNLVILHGYGAGLGFFYKNFEPLSRAQGRQLYALDLLGMGRSTRPPFKVPVKTRPQATAAAEDWFIDALEEWRVKRRIDRFTLLGHSMGGYMAVAYALKYPGHLNKLILASPVGIPEVAGAADAPIPYPNSSAKENGENGMAEMVANTAPDRWEPPPPNRIPKWFSYLWDCNISPFSIIRWTGPLAPRLVSGWTSRRFGHLGPEESKALHDYSYSIFRLRGSGEYALTYILAPGAYARSPLIRRIEGVGRQFISQSSLTGSPSTGTSSPAAVPSALPLVREPAFPIIFMYGDRDWMDVNGGYSAKAKIDAERTRFLRTAPPEEREKEGRGWAKVLIVKEAGHHLYLDGWEEFNDMVEQEMKEVEVAEWKRRERERAHEKTAAPSRTENL